MKDSLSDLWASWVELHHGAIPKESFSVPVMTLVQNLLPTLSKQGIRVPSKHRAIRLALERGLNEMESPPVLTTPGRPSLCVTYYHFLNLVWEPIIEHIESLLSNPNSKQKPPEINKAAIEHEMQGIVVEVQEVLTIDAWVEFIQETLSRFLQIDVPARLIMTLVSSIAPLSLDTTRANGLHLLCSSLC